MVKKKISLIIPPLPAEMKRGFLFLLALVATALIGYLVMPWVSRHPVEFRAVDVSPELSGRRVLRYEVKNTSWFTVEIFRGYLNRPDEVDPGILPQDFMLIGELKPGEIFEGQYFLERDRPFPGGKADIYYYWSFPLRIKASRAVSALIDYVPGEIQWRIEKLREARQTSINDVELPAEFGAGF
jgi:hypothetical protein